jgi:serine/threonine protein kinase
MIHAHLAKDIDAPHTVDPSIPIGLSNIVYKLIRKTPDQRYQSAAGLRYDLGLCINQIDSIRNRSKLNEPITDGLILKTLKNQFEIATRDFKQFLVIPKKLFGREKEAETLEATRKRITLPQATPEIIIVEGDGGVGKLSLLTDFKADCSGKGCMIGNLFFAEP